MHLSQIQLQIICDNYLLIPKKPLARAAGISVTTLNRVFKEAGIVIPPEIVAARKKASQFRAGHIPFSAGKKQHEYMSQKGIEAGKKTRFKKGHVPVNVKYDGHERIDRDGYVLIRVRKGKYVHKHKLNWEKVHGKIPNGYCLRCQSDDPTSCDPENWRLISQQENMLLNSRHEIPEEIIPSLALVNQIKKKIEDA